MDIIRQNLKLVQANVRSYIRRNPNGDGNIIDSAVLLDSCIDMLKTVRAARKWINVNARLPHVVGRYEVIIKDGAEKYPDYLEFDGLEFTDGEFSIPVSHWRNSPKLK